MKIALAVVGLVLSVGCGGSQAIDSTAPDATPTQPPSIAQACDYCPGNTDVRTEVYSDSVMQVCMCPLNGTGFFKFRVDQPFASCEHIRCEYEAFIAGGCFIASMPVCPP